MIINYDRKAIGRMIELCRNRNWQFTEDSAERAAAKLREYSQEYMNPEERDEFDTLAAAEIQAALKADREEEAE